jgi:hypothetical protein
LLLVVGSAGLILSALWVALAFYVDAVESHVIAAPGTSAFTFSRSG